IPLFSYALPEINIILLLECNWLLQNKLYLIVLISTKKTTICLTYCKYVCYFYTMKITNSPKPKQPNFENLITVAKYAKEMGVSRQTVYNWIETGKIIQVEFLDKTFVDKSSYTPKVAKTTEPKK